MLIEDGLPQLLISTSSFVKHEIDVVLELGAVPFVSSQRHRLLEILINLVSNARHAVKDGEVGQRRITIRLRRDVESAFIEVADNGVGIVADDLVRIFVHGFTTKKNGHGFGLHSSALAAKELGGSLSVESDGRGRGACFRLTIPLLHERLAA